MTTRDKPYKEKRNIGRREEDRVTHDQIYRHEMLFELGQMITSEMNLDALFELIIEQINQLMSTERCSLFLYDTQKDQLWSLVSTELKRNEIRIPSSYGVAGWVFQNRFDGCQRVSESRAQCYLSTQHIRWDSFEIEHPGRSESDDDYFTIIPPRVSNQNERPQMVHTAAVAAVIE